MLGLTDNESLSETLVDIDVLKLQDADTLLETAVEKETLRLAANASL